MGESRPQVLVIEDETLIRRFLIAALDSHGFATIEAGTIKEGLARATEHVPDAMLVDLGLPDGDGTQFIRAVREWSAVPIIVLSARDREDAKVQALDAGADDYLTKPFGVLELLARLRAVLRRQHRIDHASPMLSAGDLRLDPTDHQATRAGVDLSLTQVEFKLLSELLRHVGKLVTHRQLSAAVWGPSAPEDAQYLRVYIHQLRRKIEPDPTQPRRLLTEIGLGYRLVDDA